MSVFQTMPALTSRRMLRHTSHLATSLSPAQKRRKARTSGAEATEHLHVPVQEPGDEVAQMHHDATMYPARERAAGGPQDRALYRCGCGYVFQATVEAGVHCPNCSAEQSW